MDYSDTRAYTHTAELDYSDTRAYTHSRAGLLGQQVDTHSLPHTHKHAHTHMVLWEGGAHLKALISASQEVSW